MQVEHIHLDRRGAFVIKSGTQRLAEMTYTTDGETMDIDHTEVDGSIRGQGVGQQLLDAAVNYARDSGQKVAATCPYAAKLLARNASYTDVFAG